MGDEVTVRLLGTFSITVDGMTVGVDDFPRRSGAELVQLLALAPGCRRHREQVFDALWPEATIERAANRLYQAASHARRAVGSPDAVVLRGEVVALFPDRPVSVDAAVIEAASTDDPETLAVAIEVWGGDLLADAPYAEWAGEARERVRRRYLGLLAAIGRWHTIIEVDPANEDAHVALIAQDVGLGNPHGALRRFEELERLLDAELGLSPGTAAVAARDAAADLLDRPLGRAPIAAAGLRAFVVVDTDPSTGPPPEPGHHHAMTEAIEAANGVVFDRIPTGLSAVFTSAAAAVSGAVACQRAVQTTTGDGQLRSSARLGVDVGEVEPSGQGWTGPVIDRAAAIAAAGSGGQIVCSSLVAELAAVELDDETQLMDLGLFQVPDQAPMRLARVVATGNEDRKTPLRISRLAGRAVMAADSPIFGRDVELQRVSHEVETARLVTVVGAGGAGKTHLARHVAATRAGDYPSGAWLCELGSVSDADGAAAEVLAGIGGQRHTDTTDLESIIRTIGDRSMLVVLDNCEHLLDQVGRLCVEILQRCPETRMLATSREPLAIEREMVVPIGELDRAASIELFCTEARRQGADVDNADPAVGRICGRLDDLALAIRLAAARARVLDLSEIEGRLADRLDAFTSPLRSELPHHRTLRAAIAWSVDALEAGPQGVLVDLSTLANRFTLDAAVAVATRGGMTRGQVLDHFDELVRRSLVSGPDQIGDQTGYRLLESIRLYARELITDNEAADRHLEYFIDRAERSDAMIRDQPDLALRRIDAAWDDIRRARNHAVDRHRSADLARLLAAVGFAASTRLRFEYLDWCEEPLTGLLDDQPVGDMTAIQARAVGAWAHMVSLRGEVDRAIETAERAYEANPNDDLVLYALGWCHMWLSTDTVLAKRYFGELAEDRAGTAGTRRGTALLMLTIFGLLERADTSGYIHQLEVLAANGGASYRAHHKHAIGYHFMRSDPLGRAVPALEDAVAIAEENGLWNTMASAREAIAELLAREGTIEQGLEATRQSLNWFVERGVWMSAMVHVVTATRALERAGRDDMAITLLSAFHTLPYATGTVLARHRSRLAQLRQRNPELFDTWWATGQTLDAPAACGLALATIDAELAVTG